MQTYLKTGMEYIVQLASNILIVLALLVGSAHAANAPNRPYKVCPTPAEAKDFPCVMSKETMAITIRGIAPPPPPSLMVVTKDKEKEDLKQSLEMKESEIKALKEEIKLLEEMLKGLMDKELEKGVNVTTPSQNN